MQYKMYVDDDKWLPELPEINQSQILDHLVGVDLPQLYAVGGEDMLFKKLGIYNINSSVLFTDKALREKLQLMTKKLPVLYYLEEESLKKCLYEWMLKLLGMLWFLLNKKKPLKV